MGKDMIGSSQAEKCCAIPLPPHSRETILAVPSGCCYLVSWPGCWDHGLAAASHPLTTLFFFFFLLFLCACMWILWVFFLLFVLDNFEHGSGRWLQQTSLVPVEYCLITCDETCSSLLLPFPYKQMT